MSEPLDHLVKLLDQLTDEIERTAGEYEMTVVQAESLLADLDYLKQSAVDLVAANHSN